MFRFTIRDALLVTAIVGLSVGWSLDHWRLVSFTHIWESRTTILAEHLENKGVEVRWTATSVVIGESPGGGVGITAYRLPPAK